MEATVAKTRNHFSRIFDRLNDITHAEVVKSTPLSKEVKKDDLIRYYSNLNTAWRI